MPAIRNHPLLIASLMLVSLSNVFAQVDPRSEADREPQIEAVQDAPSDERIAQRLLGIYNEIDSLQPLGVEVREGVVTVNGKVANEAEAQNALRLAKRIEGVVTVEDEIERSLDIEANIAPKLQKYRSDLATLIRALPLLLFALTVFVVVALAGHWLAKWSGLWKRLAPNPFLAELLSQAVRVAFIVLGLVTALNLLGATALIGTILGGAGVLGLAIGFAIRDTMENYISSIMLSLRQPFRANDHVIIESHEGIVVRLTSRATILMTRDGNHLRIPNSTVFKAVILNYTRNPERKFAFVLGVDADDDPLSAMSSGLDTLRSLPFVIDDPKPKAVIDTVGDSSISINFSAWVDQSATDFDTARSLAIPAVKSALEEAGFTLPEPIYRLRFDQPLPGFPTGESEGGASSPEPRPKSDPAAPALQSFDTSPETHLEEKVSEERFQSSEDDLLDPERPIE